MRRPEAWKIRREIARLGPKAAGLAERLFAGRRLARYDAARPGNLVQTDGAVALGPDQGPGPKIALLLIYQPAGLAPSVLQTCRHLAAQGYAPLVISNGSLKDADRAALGPAAWRIVERQNFGYDFGGYRDGIWLLDHLGIAPSRLILMNDSVWFPVFPGADLIRRMEAADADFVGVVELPRKRRRAVFYPSYFLLLNTGALRHAAFARYWTAYRQSSNKAVTVKRGEKGLPHALFRAGLRGHGMIGQADYETALARLSDEEVGIQFDHAHIPDPDLARRHADLAAQPRDGAWIDAARDLLRAAGRRKPYLSTLPLLGLTHLGYPMVKKHRLFGRSEKRRIIVAAADSGLLPGIDPTMLAEMRESDA
ncbi:hypothetical protein EKE94_02450 [Mesobaculum littorinae]|uniref:Rhamnan synthesis protein F n=1 Tax=Mesobaculum littorinae TaxID=2486419 RepID=A0A438AL56_9RHOB|nr:rhamnan synthesis F family protein [Mesobaculum littorinae]RVV99563.1 hypothetical protein EKE94_02450 [Mesobaculum littorinae]